jgi:hypothetical protein
MAGDENKDMENGNNGRQRTTLTELMKDRNLLNTEIIMDGLYNGKFGEFLLLTIFGKSMIINKNNINYDYLKNFYITNKKHLIIRIEKKLSSKNRIYYRIDVIKILE